MNTTGQGKKGEGVELYGNMDAAVWAKDYVRLFGGDEGLMLSWFASAIMTGFDHGKGPINGDHAQHLLDKEKNMDDKTMEEARGIAARCWCEPKTSGKVMDPDLAEEFARVLAPLTKKAELCGRMEKELGRAKEHARFFYPENARVPFEENWKNIVEYDRLK